MAEADFFAGLVFDDEKSGASFSFAASEARCSLVKIGSVRQRADGKVREANNWH
jgi:hypothetical protein